MQLIDPRTKFLEDGAGRTVIQRAQHLGTEFFEGLRASRDTCRDAPSREMERVCSVPVVLADKWLREGFDMWSAKPRDIVARLRLEGHDDLITTTKAI